jgi:EAL domain-containing protein (putative c-di-GMP-specific phosphodiesterase class I)/DNA-binding NarL/FixJ family response regulator/GGDEF domain-containing protein
MNKPLASHLQGECLLLADTVADASSIEAALRQRGHSIRVVVAPGPETLVSMLQDADSALGIIIDRHHPGLRLRELLRELRQQQGNLPILIWADTFDATQLREALEMGAQGLLSRADQQLSALLMEREWQISTQLRQLSKLRDRLGEQSRKDTAAMEDETQPILIVQEGIIVHCNMAAAQQLGHGDREALIAMPILDCIAPSAVGPLRDAMRALRKDPSSSIDTPIAWTTDGPEGKPLPMRLSGIEHDDEPAIEIRGLSVQEASNVAEQRRRLHQWIKGHANSGAQPLVLMNFGLDNPAEMEDRVGLLGLDEIRTQFLDLLSSQPLPGMQMAPLDGACLAIAAEVSSLESAQEWVQARQRQIGRHDFDHGDKSVAATASATLQVLPPPPRDPDSLISRGQQALIEMRKQHTHEALQVIGDHAEEVRRREEQRRWAARVREAMADDRFDLAFQNIACLADNPREHVDVLLRLRDTQGEVIPARRFMPAAQAEGMMPSIDRWVVSHALKRLEEGPRVFFVRLDAATVAEYTEFLQWLRPLWESAELDPQSLVIVLRERMLQTQMRQGRALLEQLRQMGIATALDHFGISTQSHEILRRIPVDFVKLHADFTQAIVDSQNSLGSFGKILEVARQQRIATIAERVTSANAMARLWQLGVNYIMGSHVHEPEIELRQQQRFSLG